LVKAPGVPQQYKSNCQDSSSAVSPHGKGSLCLQVENLRPPVMSTVGSLGTDNVQNVDEDEAMETSDKESAATVLVAISAAQKGEATMDWGATSSGKPGSFIGINDEGAGDNVRDPPGEKAVENENGWVVNSDAEEEILKLKEPGEAPPVPVNNADANTTAVSETKLTRVAEFRPESGSAGNIMEVSVTHTVLVHSLADPSKEHEIDCAEASAEDDMRGQGEIDCTEASAEDDMRGQGSGILVAEGKSAETEMVAPEPADLLLTQEDPYDQGRCDLIGGEVPNGIGKHAPLAEHAEIDAIDLRPAREGVDEKETEQGSFYQEKSGLRHFLKANESFMTSNIDMGDDKAEDEHHDGFISPLKTNTMPTSALTIYENQSDEDDDAEDKHHDGPANFPCTQPTF
jgi:hypothetical protein